MDWALWNHFNPAVLNPEFKTCVKRVVDWADVAMVEYTFFAASVTGECRRKKIKAIVTAYDVLFRQISRSRLTRYLTRKVEVKVLKNADCVVCVSEDDRRIFGEYGIDALVIPHAIDARKCARVLSAETMKNKLGRLRDAGIPLNNVCLFVGSMWHQPNVTAAERIRVMAAEMASNGQNVNFVIAGKGSSAGSSGNYHALGEVDDNTLEVLYSVADIVLIPLLSGTGASVKTIEAMAHGKAIIGTKVGFRGYPVESGSHCIISDDLSAYPAIITELLNDNDGRRGMGERAMEFAAEYDYRLVYRRYEDIIGVSKARN